VQEEILSCGWDHCVHEFAVIEPDVKDFVTHLRVQDHLGHGFLA
jgi:hypothetical protein